MEFNEIFDHLLCAKKKMCIEISIDKSKFNAIHNKMIFRNDNSPNISTVQWKIIIEIVRFLRFVFVYVSDGSRALLHHWTMSTLIAKNRAQYWIRFQVGKRIHWNPTDFLPQARQAAVPMHRKQQLWMANWRTIHQLFQHFEFMLTSAIDYGLWTLDWRIFLAIPSKSHRQL